MTDGHVNQDELKRKIRKLKKLENKIRFGNHIPANENSKDSLAEHRHASLVWDEFFDLHEKGVRNVKYTMHQLAAMNKDAFREVVSEFFYHVYHQLYEENGIAFYHAYDPDMLAQMGLRYDADNNAVKKKFRELAKKYHPDMGGESTKFIEMMEQYRKLIDG